MVTRTALKPPTLLPSRYTQGFLELQIWSKSTFDLGVSERVALIYGMRDHSDRFLEQFLTLISGSMTKKLHAVKALPQTCERLHSIIMTHLKPSIIKCHPDYVSDYVIICSSQIGGLQHQRIIIITQRLRVQGTMLCHKWHAVMSTAKT